MTVRQSERRAKYESLSLPPKERLKYGVQLAFPATNNKTEYEGVLTGLRVGKALRVKNLLL